MVRAAIPAIVSIAEILKRYKVTVVERTQLPLPSSLDWGSSKLTGRFRPPPHQASKRLSWSWPTRAGKHRRPRWWWCLGRSRPRQSFPTMIVSRRSRWRSNNNNSSHSRASHNHQCTNGQLLFYHVVVGTVQKCTAWWWWGEGGGMGRRTSSVVCTGAHGKEEAGTCAGVLQVPMTTTTTAAGGQAGRPAGRGTGCRAAWPSGTGRIGACPGGSRTAAAACRGSSKGAPSSAAPAALLRRSPTKSWSWGRSRGRRHIVGKTNTSAPTHAHSLGGIPVVVFQGGSTADAAAGGCEAEGARAAVLAAAGYVVVMVSVFFPVLEEPPSSSLSSSLSFLGAVVQETNGGWWCGTRGVSKATSVGKGRGLEKGGGV